MRKLNTNKTQSRHGIRLRKYKHEKPPEDNYREAQWQIYDNIFIPKNDLHSLAWETELGGHLFEIPIIYTDPRAIDFDESHTQGPDIGIVPRSYFHDSSDGQNRETGPTFDPSSVHPSNPKSHGQSRDIDTARDLCYNDLSTEARESNTDIETAYKPMQQAPSRQNDNSSTLESNDPTIEIIPQNEPGHSRGGQYNLRPNPNPNYAEINSYCCEKTLFQPLS